MALKLVGAGYGRTGTASVKMALEQLGFGRCYHMSEVFKNPAHMQPWERAADGDVDWDDLLADYSATIDFPACTFYRELAAHYPEAKVLLTVRDPGTWFDSVHATIMGPQLVEFAKTTPFRGINEKIIWNRFDHRLNDRDHMIACFERHTEEVKATIPAERLLVYEAKEGWGPLCEFLGFPVPDEPFPRVNSREETAGFIREMTAGGADGMSDGRLAEASRKFHDG